MYVQFNPEGTSLAVLHHTTNCSTGHAAETVLPDDTVTATVELVTVDLGSSQVWVLPLDEVRSFDYGRWHRLLVSSPQGLYEADVEQQSMQKLKPPAIGMPLIKASQQRDMLAMYVQYAGPSIQTAVFVLCFRLMLQQKRLLTATLYAEMSTALSIMSRCCHTKSC